MSAWTLYWIMQLDGIKEWMGIWVGLGIIGSLSTCVISLYFFCEERAELSTPSNNENTLKKVKPWRTACITIFALASLAYTLTPSTKTMAAVVVVPKIIKDGDIEAVAQDAKDLYKVGIKRLKEILGEEQAKQ